MLLNSALMMDTLHIDASAQKHLYYYYTVRAVDSLFNESPPTAQLRSRIVSLDMGILLVDQSADSIGAPGNPTEQELDDYYSSLLEGYTVTPYDVKAEGRVALADMGAYSTVVWFSDDLSDFAAPLAAQNDVRRYTEFGGKFFFAGFRPTRAFTGNNTARMTFAPGDFMWDVMGIRSNDIRTFSRFSGAVPHCRLLSGRHGGSVGGWAGERVPSPQRRSDIPCHGQPGGVRIRLRVRHEQPVWRLEGAAGGSGAHHAGAQIGGRQLPVVLHEARRGPRAGALRPRRRDSTR